MLDTKLVRATGRGSSVNLTIDDAAPLKEVLGSLRSYLAENRLLYSTGTVSVNVGRRMLEQDEIASIRELLETETGVTVSRFWCQPSILEEPSSPSSGTRSGPASEIHQRPGSSGRGPDQEPTGVSHNDPSFFPHVRPRPAPRNAVGQTDADRRRFTLVDRHWPSPLQDPPTTRPATEPGKRTFAPFSTAKGDPEPPPGARPFRSPSSDEPAEESTLQPIMSPFPAASGSEPPGDSEPNPGTPAFELAPPETPTEATGNPGESQDGQAAVVAPTHPADSPDVNPVPAPDDNVPSRPTPTNMDRGNEALLVKTNCRSGEIVSYRGDVVVMADVNPGAQIIADGDILVFGKLRGFAHAGAAGDPQATIVAFDMQSPRLQIGPHTGISPEADKQEKSNRNQPKIAYVRRQAIYVSDYAGRFGTYNGGTLYDG